MTQTSFSGQAICADGSRECEAHGTEPTGGNQRARMLVVEVLRLPHLVLSYVGGDDGVAASNAPQIVHDVRRVEMAGVRKILDVANSGFALACVDGLEPYGASRPRCGAGLLKHFRKIADERYIDLDVLVDLGGIDLDVDLFGLGA